MADVLVAVYDVIVELIIDIDIIKKIRKRRQEKLNSQSKKS